MIKSLIFATAFAATTTLTGCAPPQQACAGYGYQPGSHAFAECSERRAAAVEQGWRNNAAYWNGQNQMQQQQIQMQQQQRSSYPRCYHVMATGQCAHWGP